MIACAAVAACLSKPGPPGAGLPGDASGISDGGGGDGVGPVGDAQPTRNYVFVTSALFHPPQSALAADGVCTAAATAGHRVGYYVAWLSFEGSGLDAQNRVRDTSGHDWYTTEDTPFAANIDDVVGGMLSDAPKYDEFGVDATIATPGVEVATGTTAQGNIDVMFDADCTAGSIAVGLPGHTDAAWTEYGVVPCATNGLRLYCFGYGAP